MKHVNGTTRRNRILSFVLALAMAVTLLPAGLITARTAKAEESTVKLYFKLPDGTSVNDWCANVWGTNVGTKGDSDQAFRPESWGNGDKFPALLEDTDHNGFGYVSVTGSVSGMQFVNKTGSKEYKCWNAEIANQKLSEAYFNPSNSTWYKDSELKDEINSASVRNIFKIVGTIPGTDWNEKVNGSTKNLFTSSDNKNYSITFKDVQPGTYEFKILQDPDNKGWDLTWGNNLTEKPNAGGNRELDVTAPADVTFTLDATDANKNVKQEIKYVKGLVFTDQPLYVVKGASVELNKTAAYYDGNGAYDENADVTYTLQKNENGVSLAGNKLSVSKDYSGTSINLIAKHGTFTNEVVITPVNKLYDVTVNIYNQNADPSKGDLYIFDKGGATNTTVKYSGKTVSGKDDSGNEVKWYSFKTTIPFNKLGLIARPTADSWAGQDGNGWLYTIPESATQPVTIWYIVGEKPVDKEPVVQMHDPRYVDITYTNDDATAPKFYSWTINDDTHFPFKKHNDGKWYVRVKVPYSVTSVKFVIALDDSGNDWVKDGGDHELTIPADQNLVFYSMNKGKEPELAAPYNVGYETDPDNGKVHFYYRDDTDLSGEKTVSVDIKGGSLIALTWNAKNLRYEGTADLKNGKTYYRYKVGDTYVKDVYNTNEEGDYSYFEYNKPVATFSAKLDKGSIDYNTNDVVRIDFTQEKKSASDPDIRIASATIDASALGAGVRNIDPDNKAVTIACTQNTKAGSYTLPITVKDQFGNVYRTSVTEKVTARTKKSSDDFDWDEANIYFMVTDRFFDGDSSNNTANDQFITDADKAKGVKTTYGKGTTAADGLYHGGDFKGIEDKLDYLKDLGINTIWITPVVQNIAGVTVGADNHGEDVPYNAAFHGYWASDFTKLNPALGTDADFQSMISAAHKKGIRIMVDIVVNHAGYGTESTFGNMLRSSDEQVSGDDQKSSLSDLPDFKTEDPEVRAKLVKWQTEWVKKFGIDYFRVDTVKHVDVATWQALKNSLTDVDPSFKMIGEYSGGGSASNGGTLGSGAMDSDLDFDFNDWAKQFVKGGISSTESNLSGRNGRLNSTYQTGQFLGSHDEDGFVYKLEQDGMSGSDAQAAALVAASLQLTAKGQPVIYYGEEVGQTGANNYPYQTNRYDFDWDDANTSNFTFVHYRKLLAIRNQYTDVYARGDRKTVEANDNKGYDVFTRTYDGTTLYNILNTKSAQDVTVSGLKSGSVYTDLYNGKTYVADNDGKITISVPAASDGGTVILAEGKVTSKAASIKYEPKVTPVTPSEPSDDNPATPDTPAVTPDKPAVDPEKPSTPSVDPDQPSKPETPSEPEKPSPEKVEAVADKNGTFKSEDGKTVTNSVVETADGKTYITDDEGKAVKKQVVETSDGKKYLATKDGSLATEGIAKVGGKKYVVTEDSTLAPKGVYENRYVVKNDDGQLAKKEIVSVKETVNGKTTTVKYYADKNGRIVKNKVVSVKGSKYLTDKKGRVITGKWMTKGKKKYYCSKSGRITKTVKIKKKSSKKK